ncbi:hypothetical protein B0H11DRAFT_1949279, partial [Mycena galericulata]
MSILPVRPYPSFHPPFCLCSALSTFSLLEARLSQDQFIKTARFKSQDSVGPIPQPKPRKRSPSPSKALFKALLKALLKSAFHSGCLHQETNVKTSLCVRWAEPWRRSSLRSSLRDLVCLGPMKLLVGSRKIQVWVPIPLSHPCFLPTVLVLVLHLYVFSTCFLPITFVSILHGVWIWYK